MSQVDEIVEKSRYPQGHITKITKYRSFQNENFGNFYLIKCFTLDNFSTFGHITLKFVGRYFHWFVTILNKRSF